MMRDGYQPYEPQLTICAQGEDIWTVDGPEVQYRLAGALIPCPTRMTVVRRADSEQPEKGEIIHYYAVNRWDQEDEFDEWAKPLVALTAEAEAIIGVTNGQLADKQMQ